MLKNYFKTAWRSIMRQKVFTMINVTGLAIGISAALVIYMIAVYDFSFDSFHPKRDKIYHVVTNFTFSGVPYKNGGVTSPLGGVIKNEIAGITEAAPFYIANDDTKITVPDGTATPLNLKKQDKVVYADARYFNIFQYKWLAGEAKTALSTPYKVVLTQKQAELYFPRLTPAQVIGRKVIYNDTVNTVVTGVVENLPGNTDFVFHDFISFSSMGVALSADQQKYNQRWDNTTSASQLFVVLDDKATVANIEAQLEKLQKKYDPNNGKDFNGTQDFKLQPLKDIHFNSEYATFNYRTANLTTLYGLLAIAAFLLVLGCINFINLTTAQAVNRAKEIGIRKTIGGNRKQIIVQFLSETFLITVFAVLVSIALVPLILKFFTGFIPEDITVGMLKETSIIIFLILLSVIVCLLSGFYPAMVLSGYKPVSVLKNQTHAGTGKTRNAWLRKSLTVTQFVIAQFFIMATILVSKQISYTLNKDLGFKQDAVLFVNTPWRENNADKKQVFVNKLKSFPQIENISIGSTPPSSAGYNTTSVKYIDGKKEIKTDLQLKNGDENYINVYKIKLLAGRNITKSDTTQMMINETYLHTLGFKKPEQAIGKFIEHGDTKDMVIGVVNDFYSASLHSPIKPLAIVPAWKYNNYVVHVALKPKTEGGGEWKKAIAQIQAAWKEVYPEYDIDYGFVDESIAKFYESEQRMSKLLAWSTGLSVFISCLGLLGLAIYTTGQRTKEIGIRKVLGSSVRQIVSLLSKELVLLVILAFVIVTPLAWWAMHKWIENFAEHTAISWWVFALGGLAMLLTAIITLSFQTVKAAMANPVKSLRSE
ncbi:ABC transporter permease [Mucilaginibacter limnophilus]|uniref:ABC transporter permease n=1 Tax=Mucilaginibacter limnophilus TaxID=1932778 RepID=A0A3S2UPD6_9SPHI|nr:ABC transporter permease [Mucilaginibacter limnophilus]RVU02745.1 ABC transporter permease [Mucilaginibacter limnophilus]